jgi:hypothetical protein
MTTLIECNDCTCLFDKTSDSPDYCQNCGSVDIKEREGVDGKGSARLGENIILVDSGQSGVNVDELNIINNGPSVIVVGGNCIPSIEELQQDIEATKIKEEHVCYITARNEADMLEMISLVKRSKTRRHKDLMKKGRQEFHKKGK